MLLCQVDQLMRLRGRAEEAGRLPWLLQAGRFDDNLQVWPGEARIPQWVGELCQGVPFELAPPHISRAGIVANELKDGQPHGSGLLCRKPAPEPHIHFVGLPL